MDKIVIELPVRKGTEKPWECELCGKKKMTVDIYCGGPFFKLCPECERIASKAIDGWVRMIYYGTVEQFVNTVQDIMKSLEETKKRITQ